VFIGLDPNTGFVKGSVDLDDRGLIVTDMGLQSSMPGVFAAGDVRAGSTKQLASAVGEGAAAAIGAGKSVASIPYVGAVLAAIAIATIAGLVASQIAKAKSFAIGTHSAPGGLSMVGERGPEMTRLPAGAQVFTAGETKRFMNSQANHNYGGVNITVNDQATGDKLMRALRTGELNNFVSDFSKKQRQLGYAGA